jgi:hypothetical protein
MCASHNGITGNILVHRDGKTIRVKLVASLINSRPCDTAAGAVNRRHPLPRGVYIARDVSIIDCRPRPACRHQQDTDCE